VCANEQNTGGNVICEIGFTSVDFAWNKLQHAQSITIDTDDCATYFITIVA